MAYFIPAPVQTAQQPINLIPDFNSFPGVSGFNLSVASNTTMTVTPGYARAFNNDFAISYPGSIPNLPANITINTAVVGANGVYPNSIASLGLTENTVFGVYIIAKSSGTTDGSLNPSVSPAAVIATGNNFLPPGYDAFRRIGLAFINESTGNLIVMNQAGNANERVYMLEAPVQVLSAGASTTFAHVDLTVNGGPVLPEADVEVIMQIAFTANAAGDTVTLQPYGQTGSTVVVAAPAGALMELNQTILTGLNTSGNAAIDYKVSSGSDAVTLNVAGFKDSLGNSLF